MKTILYFDDDEDDRFLFDKAINEIKESCDVLYASTAFDLFKILENVSPDIIFLDLDTPGVNGIECLRKIRSTRKLKALPVAIYSTYLNHRLIEKCAAEKVNLVIRKPCDYRDVVEMVKNITTYNWKPYLVA